MSLFFVSAFCLFVNLCCIAFFLRLRIQGNNQILMRVQFCNHRCYIFLFAFSVLHIVTLSIVKCSFINLKNSCISGLAFTYSAMPCFWIECHCSNLSIASCPFVIFCTCVVIRSDNSVKPNASHAYLSYLPELNFLCVYFNSAFFIVGNINC